jgi:hypothetical protein
MRQRHSRRLRDFHLLRPPDLQGSNERFHLTVVYLFHLPCRIWSSRLQYAKHLRSRFMGLVGAGRFKNDGALSVGDARKESYGGAGPNARCSRQLRYSRCKFTYFHIVALFSARRKWCMSRIFCFITVAVQLTHNIPLLRDIVDEDLFRRGDITTKYLPQTYPEGFKGLYSLTQMGQFPM